MNKSLATVLLLFAILLTLSCGGSNRRLQSISISATSSDNQIQLLATGTFSGRPTTVTPLPVFWFVDLPPAQYSLTTQPFLIECSPGAYLGPFIAMAPADPNAPSSGSISATKMISASTSCTELRE